MGGKCNADGPYHSDKENKWTQSIAVGSKTFIEKMKEALGIRATGRKIICAEDTFELREMPTPYGKVNNLDSANTFYGINPSSGSGSIDNHHP